MQQRQYDIAVRYLNGQFYRLFGYVPLYRSWEKTAGLFEKVVKNGPYSPIAPQAQMDIGASREKQKDYPLAVKAYERAADRYADQKQVAADATFKAGLAYQKEARTADYDQSVSGKAIATFTDFIALYEDDPRVPDARRRITALRSKKHSAVSASRSITRRAKSGRARGFITMLLTPSMRILRLVSKLGNASNL